MAAYADLEIGLDRRDTGGYTVQMRYAAPGGDADVRLTQGGPYPAELEPGSLQELASDGAAYGRRLSAGLFSDPAVLAAFGQARAAAESQDAALRVRLLIGPTVPELHALRWETLRDPTRDGVPLLTDERILFSRYLSSLDWRPVRLRPRAEMRALVVIANPSNLAAYRPGGRGLAAVDVEGELARARAGLDPIPVTALASGGSATVNGIIDQLRDGYDILYLVCHGALIQGEPRLWLEDDTGASAVTAGSELVNRLRELEQRPRLVVLASCQSAGTGQGPAMAGAGAGAVGAGTGEGAAGAVGAGAGAGAGVATDDGTLSALGPRLAEAGIPAVVAMQGNVTMETVARFFPIFFKELRRDGQIDRATAAARGAVRDRFDAWMPVLYMRLKSGRIWYNAGFADDAESLKKWPALLRNIEAGRCTPILGPGLLEGVLGRSGQIARRWAEAYSFPMAPHQREEMPQVAQFLSVEQDRRFPREELRDAFRQEVQQRFDRTLPETMRSGGAGVSLEALLAEIGAQLRARSPAEPHQVLASLPLPLFITTNPDSLLVDALRAAGRDPQIELCRWNEDIQQLPSIYDAEPNFRPDPKRPLVYYLFGRLEEPDSLVLTEDDYFDFLIGVTGNRDLIPGVVRRALADSALVFLGFQMDEWNFRVLYRTIMSQEGGGRRNRYAHVAAQIDPEEGRILEPGRARRYLESYFHDADISIYWGSIEGFMDELHRRRAGR